MNADATERRRARARSEIEELIVDSGKPVGSVAEIAAFVVAYPNSIRLILDRADDPVTAAMRKLTAQLAVTPT